MGNTQKRPRIVRINTKLLRQFGLPEEQAVALDEEYEAKVQQWKKEQGIVVSDFVQKQLDAIFKRPQMSAQSIESLEDSFMLLGEMEDHLQGRDNSFFVKIYLAYMKERGYKNRTVANFLRTRQDSLSEQAMWNQMVQELRGAWNHYLQSISSE